MSDATHDAVDPKVAQDRKLLADAQAKGTGATLKAFVKLSGPGWLQSAITLGGGSLAGSLYLGVIAGYQFNWLQPMMMILGVVMLCAIAYVTLSTGERPFGAINRHINPVLGWGWLLAAMMANLVWAMPQFSLGTAAVQQNLLPGLFGGDNGKYIVAAILFTVSFAIVLFYDTGAIKYFEWILKAMVGVIVVSFFGVVAALALKGHLPWGDIFAGFIPDFSLINQPSDGFTALLNQTARPDYWRGQIVTQQQDVMITAAATAVGINMTFLLPYSMLRKGWGPTFRGLAAFDLSTGLFIPFMLATSCVVVAAANQFYLQYNPALVATAAADTKGDYRKRLEGRINDELGVERFAALSKEQVNAAIDALPQIDKKLSAMLVTRDAQDLAKALDQIGGSDAPAATLDAPDAAKAPVDTLLPPKRSFTQYVFGVGVLGMAVSTIIILMLINGFCMTEMLGLPPRGPMHIIGSLLPGITGAAGFLFLWGDDQARFWLAVPTSRIGMILLPVAYITFFMMMNSRSLLGRHMPTGGKRIAFNAAMLVAIVVASIGSAMAIWNTRMKVPGTDGLEARWPIIGLVVAFVALAIIVQIARAGRRSTATE